MTDAARTALRDLFARHPESVPRVRAELRKPHPRFRPHPGYGGVTVFPWPYQQNRREMVECCCLVAFMVSGGLEALTRVGEVHDAFRGDPAARSADLLGWLDRAPWADVARALECECEAFAAVAAA